MHSRAYLVWCAAACALLIALLPGTTLYPVPAHAATGNILDETFSDHANNWNPAAGTWGINNGQYTDCLSGTCGAGPLNVDRSWIGFAANASSYIIDADLAILNNTQECKIIYTGANNNEDYRVDIRNGANQVRVTGPSPTNVQTWTPGGSHAPITGNGAMYHLQIVVSTTNITVYYRQGSESLDQILSLGTSISPDGKIGVGAFDGGCAFDNVAVTGNEGVGNGTAKLMPIFGYERTEACGEGPDNPYKTGEVMTEQQCDRPLFTPWNRDSQYWWNDQVEEMSHANVAVVAAHNRGCNTNSPTDLHGNGDMCPNQLMKLVNAINLKDPPMRIAMFDDFPTAAESVYSDTGQNFDMSNSSLWQKYLWDERWNRFYATLPNNLLALQNGRPLIFIWDPSSSHYTNLQGNLSRALDYLRQQTQAVYGFNPFIVVSQVFYSADTTLPGHVDAVYTWFNASSGKGTLPAANYGGYTGATVAPAFREWPQNTGPNCGVSCLQIPRYHGNGLISYLDQQKNTSFVLLEGWTNVIESAGYYRSVEGNDPHSCTQANDNNTIDYPNQSLNIVQRYANPGNNYVELLAAAADDYSTSNSGNTGGAYRVTHPADNASCTYNDLSIYQNGNGYFVGNVTAGEWLRWRDVYLPAGTYSLTIKYAAQDTGKQVCPQVNGTALPCVTLASTGSYTTFATATVGTIALHKGLSNFKLMFPQPNLNIESLTIQPS